MSKELAALYAIEWWGRQIPNGQHYSCKFRIDNNEFNRGKIQVLKKQYYPDIIVYFTKETNKIIFGGTFSNKCTFWEDAKWLIGVNTKQKK